MHVSGLKEIMFIVVLYNLAKEQVHNHTININYALLRHTYLQFYTNIRHVMHLLKSNLLVCVQQNKAIK